MENKIRLKIGPIEVEYEGSEQFIKQELLDMISSVIQIYKSSEILEVTQVVTDEPFVEKKDLVLSTGSIASKLSCNNGSDLIIATAAHLTFVAEKSKFSRKEIIQEMQTSTAYYKKSYLGNLTQNLNSLIKSGKLNEPSTGHYSLPAKILSDLRKKLDT